MPHLWSTLVPPTPAHAPGGRPAPHQCASGAPQPAVGGGPLL